MNSVGQLASGIWDDLGQPQNPSVTYISGWLGNDRSIGKLNLLLDTEFIIDYAGAYAGQTYDAGGYTGVYQQGDIYVALGNTEAAIYSEIYKQDYYDKKVRDAVNGLLDQGSSGAANDWINLSEGDSTITRTNRSELIKTYRGLQTDSRSDLDKLVGYYKSNQADPRQVTFQVSQNCGVYYNWGYYRTFN